MRLWYIATALFLGMSLKFPNCQITHVNIQHVSTKISKWRFRVGNTKLYIYATAFLSIHHIITKMPPPFQLLFSISKRLSRKQRKRLFDVFNNCRILRNISQKLFLKMVTKHIFFCYFLFSIEMKTGNGPTNQTLKFPFPVPKIVHHKI